MTPVTVREGAPAASFPLTPGQQAALAASRVVKVGPRTRAGLVSVSARGYVGSARFGEEPDAVELRITPKIPIQRLLFLLGYDLNAKRWREQEVNAAEWPDLLPAAGYAFARAAERAVRQGPLRDYREVEEAAPTVRGRIRETDQLNRRHGLMPPAEVTYDDYTSDIPENQLLLTAARILLAQPDVPAVADRLLRRVEAQLVGVSTVPAGHPPPVWRPHRRNQHYRTALGLADLVLRGRSYELEDGVRVRVDGVIVTMWRVYQEFAMRELGEALRRLGGGWVEREKRRPLDQDDTFRMAPDLVYYRPEAKAPAAVADAKYAIEPETGGHRTDVFQMITYCLALGLSRGYLIYAQGAAEPTEHRIVGPAGLTIIQRSLDLSLSPDDLRAQVRAVAADILAGQR